MYLVKNFDNKAKKQKENKVNQTTEAQQFCRLSLNISNYIEAELLKMLNQLFIIFGNKFFR